MGSSGAAPEEDGGATKEQNRKKIHFKPHELLVQQKEAREKERA